MIRTVRKPGFQEELRMKKEKSCGAVVYRLENGRLFFLLEHMKKGHVSVPKGHMEDGETEEETAVREIREETGLDVRLDTVFRHSIQYSPSPGVRKTVLFFAAEAATHDMKNQESEVSALEWLPAGQAVSAVTYAEDRDVLSHAAVYLSVKHSLSADLPDPVGSGMLYRENAVDIHSHVLVGLDDGARSMEEAVDLLKLDWEEGIRVVFATPHYGVENGYAPGADDIRRGFRRLSEAAEKALPGMRIHSGTEGYCSEDIVGRIRNHEAWPMAPGGYMVEFLEYGKTWESAEDILRRLKKMKDAGIHTILAHPERYTAVQRDRDLARRIRDLGVLLQVNAYDLFLNQNEATRGLAQWMAREEMISFLGSDMHGTRPGKRRPRMKEGIRWLYENVRPDYADDVVRRNAEKYLNVEKLPAAGSEADQAL